MPSLSRGHLLTHWPRSLVFRNRLYCAPSPLKSLAISETPRIRKDPRPNQAEFENRTQSTSTDPHVLRDEERKSRLEFAPLTAVSKKSGIVKYDYVCVSWSISPMHRAVTVGVFDSRVPSIGSRGYRRRNLDGSLAPRGSPQIALLPIRV